MNFSKKTPLLVFFLSIFLGAFCCFAQCPPHPGGSTGFTEFRIRGYIASTQTSTILTPSVRGVDNSPLRVCVGTQLSVEPTTGGQLNARICQEHQDPVNRPANCTESFNSLLPAYTKTGIYGLVVNASIGGTGAYGCKVIEVVDIPTPDVTINSCVVNQVSVTINNAPVNRNFSRMVINWGTGLPQQVNITSATIFPLTVTRTTIANSATVTVSGFLNSSNFCSKDVSKTVEILKNFSVPAINYLTLQDEKTVRFTVFGSGTTNFQFDIVKRTNFPTNPPTYSTVLAAQQVGTGGLVQTRSFIVNVDDASKEQVCFNTQLKSASCASTIYGTSVDICTSWLTVDALPNKQNVLKWQAVPGAASYQIYRGVVGAAGGGALIRTVNGNTTTTFTDNTATLKCNERNTYYIVAQGNVPAFSSQSNTKDVLTLDIKTPPALKVQELFASVENNNIRISPNFTPTFPPFFPNQNKQLIYKRTDDGDPAGAYRPIATKTQNPAELIDKDVDPSTLYCYKLQYQDQCNNLSEDSPAVCPIVLSQTNDERIAWTPYIRYLQGVSNYTIIKKYKDANGATQTKPYPAGTSLGFLLNNGVGSLFNDPNDASQKVTLYIISAPVVVNGINQVPSKSNEIEVVKPVQVYIPDIFTPNNDGSNDTFGIMSTYLSKLEELTIFDRWGAPVYSTSDLNFKWDSTMFSGQSAPDGVYTYSMLATDQIGNVVTKQGTVMIVR